MRKRSDTEVQARREVNAPDLPRELFGRHAIEVPEQTLPVLRSAFAVDGLIPRPPEAAAKRLAMYHRRTMQLAKQHNLPIRPLGPVLLLKEPHFYEGVKTNWILMPWERDPLYRLYNGELVVPDEVDDELDRMLAAGVDFHAIYLGHELPKGYQMEPGEVPIELLLPPSHPAVQQRVNDYAQRHEHLWSRVTGSVTAGAGATAVAATGAAAVVGAIAGAAVGIASAAVLGGLIIDPVIFGILTDESWRANDGSARFGLVYVVAAWSWAY